MNVHMRIDEARKDKLPGGIDHLATCRSCDVAIDPRDRLVLAINIRHVAFAGGDDLAILDQ